MPLPYLLGTDESGAPKYTKVAHPSLHKAISYQKHLLNSSNKRMEEPARDDLSPPDVLSVLFLPLATISPQNVIARCKNVTQISQAWQGVKV